MTRSLKNEFLYGSRALIRDNLFSRQLVDRLRQNEVLSAADLQRYQSQLLHRTLTTAIRELPFYSKVPADFAPEEAVQVLREHFPVIDKRTLLDHPQDLYPNGGKKRPWQAIGKTSGTTGTPLAVIRSQRSVQAEQAFIKRHWTWSGYRDGMPRATLRGDMVVDVERRDPPFWFFNRYNNQLLLSSRHLIDTCAPQIIDELERFAPHMLQAYPSTAYTLAQYLQRQGRVLRIPFLFSASEPLYPHQRELILEYLAVQIMDMYGMAERVAFATECEHGSMHINPDYSFVEILDEDGQPTDGEGYIVGTTLHNLAMPLVRYRLSDRTQWRPGTCQCGRPFPMIEPVSGKYEDVITGSNGAVISPSVLTFAFKGVHNIRKSQVAQVAPGKWQVRVVPDTAFSANDSRKLVENLHALVDPGVDVEVILRDDIPNTAAGKFRWVVNESKA